MRPTLPVLTVFTIPLLSACGQQEPAPNVDPLLGRACFAERVQSLPPGSQYEGIQAATADTLTIKIMDGTGVTSVDCELTSDGRLKGTGD